GLWTRWNTAACSTRHTESLNHVTGLSMAKRIQLPRLSRVEFYSLQEDELAASLARAIAEHIDRYPRAKLTDAQAAISAWSAAAINVPNGGFVQFFYNHQGDHGVP